MCFVYQYRTRALRWHIMCRARRPRLLLLDASLLGLVCPQTETLVEKPEVKAVLSSELQAKVVLPVEFLSGIILASIVGCLVFSSILMAKDATAERLRQVREAKLARARRLRCRKTDQEIDAPKLGDGAYHIFLSQWVARLEPDRNPYSARVLEPHARDCLRGTRVLLCAFAACGGLAKTRCAL
jgi:hypothetical protein